MKQTINKKQQSSMQPVVRHASLFGVLMLSSTTLLPGVTALAAQTTDDTQNIPVTHPENTNDNQTNTPPFTLSNLDASSEWTEGELPLYLSLELTAHKQEELDTIVQLSPNVSIVDDATKVQINDETGRQIGVYVVDKELNQLHLTITEAGFTKAKLVVPIVFKSVTLGEQTVAVSIGDSILNKTISITQQEEVVGDEENDTSEVEETTEDVSTEITDQVEEVDDTSEDDSDSQEDMIVEETDQTDVEEATTSDTATKDEVDSSTVVEVEASKEETEQVESSSSESTSDSKESSEETESTETSETTESSSKEESEETDVSEESISQEEESTEVSESTDSSEEVTIESSEELAKTESKSSQEAQPRATKQVTAPAAFFSAPVGPMMARAATPQAQFIEETAYHAQGVAAQNDLYASVMIAQAILESGYGTSTLSSAPNYNLFGIKGNYKGQSVTMATQEFYNGQYVTINDQFRKYPSYKESFEDNANVLKTTSFSPGNYFYAGAWKSRTNSYRDATAWLTGRYATDPNYNTKLNSLIETHNLTQYDASGGGQTSKPDNKPVNKPANKPNNNNKPTNTKPDKNAATYTVKKGDTLYGIGLQYNVSVAQLKSWNNLTSDIIYIGQKLIVKGEATNQKPAKPAPKPEKPVTTPVNKPNQSKPAQPKPNQPKPEINTTTYMVKKGDTLYGIGLTYGVSVAQLKSWNNLTGDMIYVGQKLVIKGGSSQGSTTKPNNNKPVSKPVNNKPTQPSQNHQQSKPSATYTVKKGDTLYGIGLQYNVSVAQLKSWNNLTGDIIYIGQKLVVKGGNTQTPVSKPTNTKPVSQPVSKPVNNKPSQPANSSNQTTYKVRRGDTLYGIGLRYNVSINDIKRWNNLTSDIIYVDQVLNIGNQQTVASKPVSQKPVAKPVSTKPMNTLQYTVKSGDTLYSIALNNQTTVGTIQEANNLSGTLIFVGQTLKVPTNQQVAKPTRQGTRHKVVKGDTLWSLSQRYQASIGQLKQWNNIPGDIIYIGQNIQVS